MGIRDRNVRNKAAEGGVLAEMPERERALSPVRRRRLPGKQMLRILGVHIRKRVPTEFGMYASPKRAPIA